MRVDFHPEARAEFRSAALWYESGIGDQFVAEAAKTLERIGRTPKQFSHWPGTEAAGTVIRKAPVNRFPYIIAFEDHPDMS